MVDLTLGSLSLPKSVARSPRDLTFQSTLQHIFESAVVTWGERIALDAGNRTLAYTELDTAAQVVAERLGDGGVGPGDRVGVRIPSGTEDLYVAILGVLKAGAAYLPVDADDPQARADQILAEAGACAVLGQDLELAWRGPAGGRPGRACPEDDAWVIFTSGSSGIPKGVAVAHRAAAAFVQAESELWQVTPADRVLAGLSVAFDASCEEMWLAWAHGAARPSAAATHPLGGGAWSVARRASGQRHLDRPDLGGDLG